MLEVDWKPLIATNDLHIIDKCESKLECMFLFGAFHFLEDACRKANSFAVGEFPINTGQVVHRGMLVEGFCFWGMWPLWIEIIGEDVGPQSILFVPQLTFASNYHHDFGIFYGDKNCTRDRWKLKYGVEVDGYRVHKTRREKDSYRDTLVNYPVIRLLEEVHNPLKWFRLVMQKDDEIFQQELDRYFKQQGTE